MYWVHALLPTSSKDAAYAISSTMSWQSLSVPLELPKRDDNAFSPANQEKTAAKVRGTLDLVKDRKVTLVMYISVDRISHWATKWIRSIMSTVSKHPVSSITVSVPVPFLLEEMLPFWVKIYHIHPEVSRHFRFPRFPCIPQRSVWRKFGSSSEGMLSGKTFKAWRAV